jgi:hypothetical protein
MAAPGLTVPDVVDAVDAVDDWDVDVWGGVRLEVARGPVV